MSNKTNPAESYEKLTTFASDQEVNARAVYPVGGTQFVYTNRQDKTITVPLADYAVFITHPSEVKLIKSTTDCTAVHVWR